MKRFFLKGLLFMTIVATTYLLLATHINMGLVLWNQNYKVQKMEKGESYDVIILGDSHALAMNQSGPSGVYNYATTYFYGMEPYVYLLKRYLAYTRPPKVVILSFIAETLCEKQDYTVSPSSARLFALKEILTDPLLRKNKKKLWDMLLNRYDINRFYSSSYDRTLFNPRTGFLILGRTFHYKKTQILIPDDTYRISYFSRAYLHEFFDICRRNNIRVIIYFMPISEYAHVIPSFYVPFEKDLSVLAARYPWVYFVKPFPQDDVYPLDWTVDGTHLNEMGAEHFNQTRFVELLNWSHALAETPGPVDGLAGHLFAGSSRFIRPRAVQ